MIKMWSPKKNNNGFTIVEIIIVLVILAVLAAILIPIMLGHIEDAENQQYLTDMKNIYTAAQTELSLVYKKSLELENDSNFNIFGYTGTGLGNENYFDAKKYGLSRNIFKRAGYDVTGKDISWNETQGWDTKLKDGSVANNQETKDKNLQTIAIGVGSYKKYVSCGPSDSNYDPAKAYTVYCMIYFPEKKSDVFFFDGKNASKKWPFSTLVNGNGTYKLGDIYIQFLFIHVGGSNTWGLNDARKDLKERFSKQ